MSVQAKPHVQSAIDTADIGAKTASAAHASSGVGERGDQQQHDGAGAGEAVQQADAERLARRAQRAVVVVLAVAVQPADEHAQREQHDDDADGLLGGRLERRRERRAEQDQRQADHEQRGGVAGAPDGAEAGGGARAARVPGDERRDRHQVVGVGRVAQPEQEGDAERDDERRALEEAGEGVVDVFDHRSASQSGQAPTSGKCAKSHAKPQRSRTARRSASRSSSGTCFPQRSHAA